MLIYEKNCISDVKLFNSFFLSELCESTWKSEQSGCSFSLWKCWRNESRSASLAIDPATGLEVRKLLRPEMIQILMPRDATVPANPPGGSQQHRQFAISFRSCLFTASPATFNRYCLIHSFVQLQHFSFARLTLTFFWPQSRLKNRFPILFHHYLFASSICSWANIFIGLFGGVKAEHLNDTHFVLRRVGRRGENSGLCVGRLLEGAPFSKEPVNKNGPWPHLIHQKTCWILRAEEKNARPVHVLIIITDPLFWWLVSRSMAKVFHEWNWGSWPPAKEKKGARAFQQINTSDVDHLEREQTWPLPSCFWVPDRRTTLQRLFNAALPRLWRQFRRPSVSSITHAHRV